MPTLDEITNDMSMKMHPELNRSLRYLPKLAEMR